MICWSQKNAKPYKKETYPTSNETLATQET